MIGHSLLPWLLGALIGSMLFFALAVAPVVFRVLAAEQAGTLLRRFFPIYYLWCVVLALACSAAAWVNAAGIVPTLACLSVTILFVYARQVLMPQINHAGEGKLSGDDASGAKFKRLHRISVVINLLQLLILFAVSISQIWS